MHDLVVVGGGPAGSTLARESAERGLDVVLLEKGEIGLPLACSGHLSDEIWDFLPESARSLVENEIRGARFHVGDSTYRFYSDSTVSYALDRVEMDRLLAREAEKAGATVLERHEATSLSVDTSTVEVSTHDDVFESRLVAGCDGPFSTVRESLGFDDPGEILHGFLGFTDEDGTDDFVDVYLDVPGFFGWRIPRGDSVEYGAASRSDVREKFETYVAPDADLRDVCGGGIPLVPPSETADPERRAFLVGDAAAQVKPFTGGGIVYGMTAAGIGAEVIDPERPETLAEYETRWRDELGRDILLGRLIRRFYDLPAFVQRKVLGLFEGEIYVDMDRPTSLFNRRTARRVLGNLTSSESLSQYSKL
ncbi:MAG: NAD(P)/FAD-dependent oxidoreductase [Halobacteria archaeon]|nr:NAD(P)/FAD-dependent oxidoreductase [Halobacteria archaeon]